MAVFGLWEVAIEPEGCILPVWISNPGSGARVEVRAAIDTGATYSHITPRLAASLSLVSCGQSPTAVFGGAVPTLEDYEVGLEIKGGSFQMLISRLRVSAFVISSGSTVEVLLGRDVLGRFSFLYDGPRGYFTLSSRGP